ncbi:MAG: sigma-70 family RNA polymerase sigma factor [candidate division WOR-3 bacterium]|nr:sigma-70 family RNA polymerase sigma factor [candidate division WOR-3 bacterium]
MKKINEETFTSIVDETKGIVLAAIKKYLFVEYGNAIDDVVQETYIRAYKSLVKNKFKNQAKLSSWLYIIAKNESLRLNKKLNKEEYARKSLHSYTQELYNDQIEYEIDKKNMIEKLKKTILQLPDKYKCVLSLYIKGYNEKQISKSLLLPLGTVKSRTHRGKEILAKKLSKEENYEQVL